MTTHAQGRALPTSVILIHRKCMPQIWIFNSETGMKQSQIKKKAQDGNYRYIEIYISPL